MITARYTWDLPTLRPGLALYLKSHWTIKVLLVASLAFLVFGLWLGFTSRSGWIDIVPIFSFAAVLFFIPLLLRWKFSRAVRRSPFYGNEMNWTFDPEHLSLASDGLNTTLAWKKLVSATLSSQGILLYLSKQSFYWLPLSAFSSPADFQALQDLITQTGIPVKKVA